MVKILLTMSIRVNIPAICRIAVNTGDVMMKNAKQTRGFWSWLAGHGWANGGSNG